MPSKEPTEKDLKKLKIDIPKGPPEQWAEVWAYDSVLKSRLAYKSLKIGKKRDNDKNEYDISWNGKDEYDKLCGPLVSEQLALVSKRLALLVNQIFENVV